MSEEAKTTESQAPTPSENPPVADQTQASTASAKGSTGAKSPSLEERINDKIARMSATLAEVEEIRHNGCETRVRWAYVNSWVEDSNLYFSLIVRLKLRLRALEKSRQP
jgi:hypothetical protein